MLYIRLVDELIRYASKRVELFEGDVSRISIKRDAQRKGDQYIIPMGTSAWKTWWEHLRNEWMEPEKEEPIGEVPTGGEIPADEPIPAGEETPPAEEPAEVEPTVPA